MVDGICAIAMSRAYRKTEITEMLAFPVIEGFLDIRRMPRHRAGLVLLDDDAAVKRGRYPNLSRAKNLLRITAEILRNQIEKDDIKSEVDCLPAQYLQGFGGNG